jgi:integrase
MSLKLGKLGDRPADIATHVLRHSFATRRRYRVQRADYASLLGHKTHSITSRWQMPPWSRSRRIKRNPSCGMPSTAPSSSGLANGAPDGT